MFVVKHFRDNTLLEASEYSLFNDACLKKESILNKYLTSGDYEIAELALSKRPLNELEDFLKVFDVHIDISHTSTEDCK